MERKPGIWLTSRDIEKKINNDVDSTVEASIKSISQEQKGARDEKREFSPASLARYETYYRSVCEKLDWIYDKNM